MASTNTFELKCNYLWMEDVTISEVGVLSAPLVVLVTSEMRESASGLRFMVSSISGADDLQIIDGSVRRK